MHSNLNKNHGSGSENAYGTYSKYEIIGEQYLRGNMSIEGTLPRNFENFGHSERYYWHNCYPHNPNDEMLVIDNKSTYYIGGFVWYFFAKPIGALLIDHEDSRDLNTTGWKLELIGNTLSDPTNYALEVLRKEYVGYENGNISKSRFEIIVPDMKLRQISYNNGTPINESDIFSSIYGQLPFELVFRVLKKRTHPIAQTTFFDGVDVDKVLIVNGREFPVNTTCLSWISPVFAAMFQSDMVERRNNKIEIKDVPSAEHFGDFLAALSATKYRHPNPSNVFTIAELANRFQIPSLISVCENHLFNCLEIQIEKRIIFAVVHGLNNLKSKIFDSMDDKTARKIYKDNQKFFDARPELVVELFNRFFVSADDENVCLCR